MLPSLGGSICNDIFTDTLGLTAQLIRVHVGDNDGGDVFCHFVTLNDKSLNEARR